MAQVRLYFTGRVLPMEKKVHVVTGAQPGEGSRGSGTPLLHYENEYYLKMKNVSPL